MIIYICMKTPEISRIRIIAARFGMCEKLTDTLCVWLLECEKDQTISRLESFSAQHKSFTGLISHIGREFLHHMTVLRFRVIVF